MSEATGAEWRVGAVVEGRYELMEELGRGGMGVVHRVRHLDWRTDLAVKSPLPALFQAERLRAQFVTEAETWVSLGLHPHVCTCHYVRTVDGVPRVFAEFVSGGSLLEWVAGSGRRLYAGGPPEALGRVLDVAIQVAWGLEHAHQQGVVHRDVKPANVLMDADGTAKLTDFGLARVKDQTRQAPLDAAPGTSLLGPGGGGLTPAYASPEQAAGQPVGRRGDVYSFAVLVLELFAGAVFWQTGSAAGEALGLLRSWPVIDPALPPLPQAVADLLARCLHADPAARPASMAAVASELAQAYLAATGCRYRRPEPVAADLRADGLNNRALSLLDLGRDQEADAAFAQAAAADPRNLAVAYNAGLRRWRRGEVTDEELLDSLETIRSGADTWEARYLLAQVQMERGDTTSARALLADSAQGQAQTQAQEPSIERPVEDIRALLRAAQAGTGAETGCVAKPGIGWRAASSVGPPVRIAADVQSAITGGEDGVLRVWDLETGECRTAIHADSRLPVHAVDITPDGRYGASVCGDTIRLWDLGNCRMVRELTYRERGFSGALLVPPLYYGTVRISSDLRFVVWALDGKAELWDEVHGHSELYDAGSGHGAALDMTPDGDHVVFAVEGVLRVWMPGTDRSWVSPPAPGGMGPGVVQLSRNGQFAVTSGYVNGRVHLWDLLVTRRGRLLEGHRGGAWALAVSNYGRHVLSAGSDGTLRYWDARDGRCLRTFSGFDDAGFVAATRFDRERERGNGDGECLPDDAGNDALHALTISHDGAARHWTLPAASDPAADRVTRRAQPWLSRPRPHAELTKLATRAEELLGEVEAALGDGRFAQAHDLLRRARAIEGHERDPRLLAAWRTLTRHTARTGLRASWPGTDLAQGRIQAADLSADGRTAAVARQDGTVLVQDVENGSTLRSFSVRPYGNHPVLLSLCHDGTRLLATEQDRILLWSVHSGECRRFVLEGQRGLRSVRFAIDADHALIGGYDGRTEHWDLRDGTLLAECDIHLDSAAWAGPVPLGATADGLLHTVQVMDLATGETVLRLDAPGPPPGPAQPGQEGMFFNLLRDMKRPRVDWTAVALSSNGALLLTGNIESAIQLWDVATGEQLRTFEVVPGHIPSHIRFTADGHFALTAGRDFKLRAWSIATGACLGTIGSHLHPIEDIVLATDARRILSWSIIDGARVWELDWDLATPAH
ncbi:serine/threonine-protein kinase [Actinoallomurus sp. NPDC050550]|uniref:WD40 repeat domain-containing serine/threonine protein kinase n=1 Tax=Actinoallomurus sp. NPDC050550 TaxID=3154937 RepID=UPI0033DA0CDA